MLVRRAGTRILIRYQSRWIVIKMQLQLTEKGGLRGEAPKFFAC